MAVGVLAGAGAEQALAAEHKIRLAIAPKPPSMTTLAVGVAIDQKFFEEMGVDLELVFVKGSTVSLRGLEADQAEAGINAATSQIPAVATGSKVKQFYGFTQTIQHQYLVAESIKTCEDLKGEPLAMDTSGGFLDTLTRAMLASCGLTVDDVTLASNLYGSAAIQALVNGQVSGMAYAPESAQQYILQFPEAKLHVLANFPDIAPDEAGQGIGANEKTRTENKEALAHFTAAMIKANNFINDPANKEEVIDIAQDWRESPTREPIALAFDAYLAGNVYPRDGEIGLPRHRFEFTTERLAEADFFPKDKTPTYDQIVDTSIYERAVEILKDKAN